jgi:hypothetical protein
MNWSEKQKKPGKYDSADLKNYPLLSSMVTFTVSLDPQNRSWRYPGLRLFHVNCLENSGASQHLSHQRFNNISAKLSNAILRCSQSGKTRSNRR